MSIRSLFRSPVFVAGKLSLVISVCLALFGPRAVPNFHDEFSYLLAADTFAHGRLTNPPHAMAKFFETFQELMRPTYASKYPPAQGIALAIGQLIFGEPLAGAIVSTALACAAVGWMLQSIVPRRWALLGAILTAMHPVMIQWSRDFWGGSVAVIGGAMLIGALLRAQRNITRLSSSRERGGKLAILASIGIAILLNSRPFEGAVLTLICGSIFIVRNMRSSHREVIRFIAMTLPILVLAAAWMGYYNWRVTGDPTRSPYVEYEAQYAVTPALSFLPIPDGKKYSTPEIGRYYNEWELPRFQKNRAEPFRTIIEKTANMLDVAFVRSPALLVPIAIALIAAVCGSRFAQIRLALIVVVTVFALSTTALWMFPHYVGPYVCLIAFLTVSGLRIVRIVLPRHVGTIAIAVIIAFQACTAVAKTAELCKPSTAGWATWRDEQQRALAASGKHLVLVHMANDAYLHFEFVYNAADIDASPVVWAHDRGEAEDAALIAYYPDRQVWRVDVTRDAVTMNRFSNSMR